jgi:hypothetical protein
MLSEPVVVVAKLARPHVEAFTSALAGEFYVDADMIRDAIQRRASFNVIHLATMFKADVFIFQGDSWSREEGDGAGADGALRLAGGAGERPLREPRGHASA